MLWGHIYFRNFFDILSELITVRSLFVKVARMETKKKLGNIAIKLTIVSRSGYIGRDFLTLGYTWMLILT